jgi:hypothetical protein
MSCCTLFEIDSKGNVDEYQTYKNAFRGAFLIWGDFAVRYNLASRDTRFNLLSSVEDAQKIWDLADAKHSLPRHHRIVMMATFDNYLCRSENFPELIDAFRTYHSELTPEDKMCHVAAWAESLAMFPSDSLGCGWQHTSVIANPWAVCLHNDPEDPDYRPYNIHQDTTHTWLFDQL